MASSALPSAARHLVGRDIWTALAVIVREEFDPGNIRATLSHFGSLSNFGIIGWGIQYRTAIIRVG
jgi:hypothetical protein